MRSIFTSCSASKILCSKQPRVLPVTHQVIGDHNSQYFTGFPQYTKEELEEPPPRVSEEVKTLLKLSRPRWEGTKWIPAQIKSWKFRKQRKELILAGHYFPEFPMRDRMLDPMPKVRKHVVEKEERLKRIEENMRMMPQWIAEYKENRRQEKIRKQKQKGEEKIALMHIEKLGLHPKDPRAKLIIADKMNKPDAQVKKKKKFGEKKKSSD
ncbi:uncharacterized protein LOC130657438 isoform X2 [Hydractinia symbiolongicarpus]|uniref:uncharacterized protein LOC130657438 isoform X2 n=1 Tax=Hydractinia symbiolongicarpus TaxID=13093 RepID=UPI00254F6C8C|nr:uncharacterized protein LOC130657438 isoform X2 [Hydractinia symbiolongicarpus]